MRTKSFLYDIITDRNTSWLILPVKFILIILSFVYFLFIKFLLFLYRKEIIKNERLPLVTISIGNVTWGGTGKTPLVQFVAEILKTEGRRVAILSRGYGKIANSKSQIASYEKMGDEAFMLSLNLEGVSVIIDSDRVRGAREAIRRSSADTAILDDGFQQWKIKKDLEIVTIDANNPFGNGWLMPRGILREPPSSLKRADVIFLTKVNFARTDPDKIKTILKKINSRALILESVYEPKYLKDLSENNNVPPDFLKAKEVCAVSGIASPDSFKKVLDLMQCGIKIAFDFPDHYVYGKADLERIVNSCKSEGVRLVVTTEKDAVRLRPWIKEYGNGLSFFSLIMQVDIVKDKDAFYDRLFSLYQR